jgi:sugar phosphate isomerase/epimerase
MRDLSRDTRLFAVNSATVKAWSLEQLVEGCQRAGVTAIAPWRDIVQAVGVEKAGKLIRDAGLTVTCLCRGGMFPAADEAAPRRRRSCWHRRAEPGADRRRATERIKGPCGRTRASA